MGQELGDAQLVTPLALGQEAATLMRGAQLLSSLQILGLIRFHRKILTTAPVKLAVLPG